MADHKHGDMDITDKEETFDGFIKWSIWTGGLILIAIVLMAIFIT